MSLKETMRVFSLECYPPGHPDFDLDMDMVVRAPPEDRYQLMDAYLAKEEALIWAVDDIAEMFNVKQFIVVNPGRYVVDYDQETIRLVGLKGTPSAYETGDGLTRGQAKTFVQLALRGMAGMGLAEPESGIFLYFPDDVRVEVGIPVTARLPSSIHFVARVTDITDFFQTYDIHSVMVDTLAARYVANDVPGFYRLGQTDYSTLHQFSFHRSEWMNVSAPFDITLELSHPDTGNENSFDLTFRDVRDFRAERLDKAVGLKIGITDIRAEQLDGVAYRVQELGSGAFSFCCASFLAYLRAPW
ncbi:hypothetical protein [Niveispirillum sp. KHB5.9]|uniref:hypothetical protein n=1 Tax=Niveispirillum sp. KHB5.9 TaxID=3400269 RepID=UPI003A837E50